MSWAIILLILLVLFEGSNQTNDYGELVPSSCPSSYFEDKEYASPLSRGHPYYCILHSLAKVRECSNLDVCGAMEAKSIESDNLKLWGKEYAHCEVDVVSGRLDSFGYSTSSDKDLVWKYTNIGFTQLDCYRFLMLERALMTCNYLTAAIHTFTELNDSIQEGTVVSDDVMNEYIKFMKTQKKSTISLAMEYDAIMSEMSEMIDSVNSSVHNSANSLLSLMNETEKSMEEWTGSMDYLVFAVFALLFLIGLIKEGPVLALNLVLLGKTLFIYAAPILGRFDNIADQFFTDVVLSLFHSESKDFGVVPSVVPSLVCIYVVVYILRHLYALITF